MPTEHMGAYRGRLGTVLSWASIIDDNALEQSLQIARGHITRGHVAVMPDAHWGMGACVGTAIVTEGGIYPAAVGVDIGCGMVAAALNIKAADLDIHQRRRLRRAIEERVPSGVGRNHAEIPDGWHEFHAEHGLAPSLADGWITSERQALDLVAAQQFGTLGAGNHFVELSEDEDGLLWAIVHSGSRGVGYTIARAHIKQAQVECADLDLENRDLAFLGQAREGDSFDRYIADMLWAQAYAWAQREEMLGQVLVALTDEGLDPLEWQHIHCHHNYSERLEPGVWLSRKGAVDASAGRLAVLPGSMGTDTYIVRGLGNEASYNTAPHGAGRVSARGKPAKGSKAATGAHARFTIEEFARVMDERGVVWQDRNARDLLDESPMVYKPIEVVLADSADLIEPVFRLQQIVNYKGV